MVVSETLEMKSLKQILIVVAIAVMAFPGCSLNRQGSRFANCESMHHCGCYRCQQHANAVACQDRGCASVAGSIQQPLDSSVAVEPADSGSGVNGNVEQGFELRSPEVLVSPATTPEDAQSARVEEVELPSAGFTLSANESPTETDSSSRSSYRDQSDATFSSPQSSTSDVSEPTVDAGPDWNVPSSSKIENVAPQSQPPTDDLDSIPLKAIPVGAPLKRSKNKNRIALKKLASHNIDSRSTESDHAGRLVLNARPVGRNFVSPASRSSTSANSIPPIAAQLNRVVPRNDLRFSPSPTRQTIANLVVSDSPKPVALEKDVQVAERVQPQYAAIETEPKKKKRVLLRAITLPRNGQPGVQARIVPSQSQIQYNRSQLQIADSQSVDRSPAKQLAKPFRQLQNKFSGYSQPTWIDQPQVEESQVEESWHERTARVPPKKEASLAPWRQR